MNARTVWVEHFGFRLAVRVHEQPKPEDGSR